MLRARRFASDAGSVPSSWFDSSVMPTTCVVFEDDVFVSHVIPYHVLYATARVARAVPAIASSQPSPPSAP